VTAGDVVLVPCTDVVAASLGPGVLGLSWGGSTYAVHMPQSTKPGYAGRKEREAESAAHERLQEAVRVYGSTFLGTQTEGEGEGVGEGETPLIRDAALERQRERADVSADRGSVHRSPSLPSRPHLALSGSLHPEGEGEREGREREESKFLATDTARPYSTIDRERGERKRRASVSATPSRAPPSVPQSAPPAATHSRAPPRRAPTPTPPAVPTQPERVGDMPMPGMAEDRGGSMGRGSPARPPLVLDDDDEYGAQVSASRGGSVGTVGTVGGAEMRGMGEERQRERERDRSQEWAEKWGGVSVADTPVSEVDTHDVSAPAPAPVPVSDTPNRGITLDEGEGLMPWEMPSRGMPSSRGREAERPAPLTGSGERESALSTRDLAAKGPSPSASPSRPGRGDSPSRGSGLAVDSAGNTSLTATHRLSPKPKPRPLTQDTLPLPPPPSMFRYSSAMLPLPPAIPPMFGTSFTTRAKATPSNTSSPSPGVSVPMGDVMSTDASSTLGASGVRALPPSVSGVTCTRDSFRHALLTYQHEVQLYKSQLEGVVRASLAHLSSKRGARAVLHQYKTLHKAYTAQQKVYLRDLHAARVEARGVLSAPPQQRRLQQSRWLVGNRAWAEWKGKRQVLGSEAVKAQQRSAHRVDAVCAAYQTEARKAREREAIRLSRDQADQRLVDAFVTARYEGFKRPPVRRPTDTHTSTSTSSYTSTYAESGRERVGVQGSGVSAQSSTSDSQRVHPLRSTVRGIGDKTQTMSPLDLFDSGVGKGEREREVPRKEGDRFGVSQYSDSHRASVPPPTRPAPLSLSGTAYTDSDLTFEPLVDEDEDSV
ncbi:hypothetical protein KIPB_008399, partial [Kipferlia bialata]